MTEVTDRVIRHRAVEHRAVEVGGRRARQEVAAIDRQVRRLRAYLARHDRGLELEDHGLRNEGAPGYRLYRGAWIIRCACGDAAAHLREGHGSHTWDSVEAMLRIRPTPRGYLATVETDGPRYAWVGGRRADALWRRVQRVLADAAAERRQRRLAARTPAELAGSRALAGILGEEYEGVHWSARLEAGAYTITMTHAFASGVRGLPPGRKLLEQAGWTSRGGGVVSLSSGTEVWTPPPSSEDQAAGDSIVDCTPLE